HKASPSAKEDSSHVRRNLGEETITTATWSRAGEINDSRRCLFLQNNCSSHFISICSFHECNVGKNN
ncbi:unnamed protein product, partial [Musa textilis]